MVSIVLFITLLVLLLLGVPIAICLGLSSMIVMALLDGTPPLSLLARSVVTGGDSFPLIAVPLFILAGDLMQQGGLSKRLVAFVNSQVGHIRAGLAYVNVLACMFFAAISGSAPATVAAIGTNLTRNEEGGLPRGIQCLPDSFSRYDWSHDSPQYSLYYLRSYSGSLHRGVVHGRGCARDSFRAGVHAH